MENPENVVVRFAPSPTGALHIGGVRTALYNYLFAKQKGGKFILRIEDTDATRYVPGAEEYIINSLKWCGITFDEGVGFGGEDAPYRQSERKRIYNENSNELVFTLGKAYIAFDTKEELDALTASSKTYNHATRLSMRNTLTMSNDEVIDYCKRNVPCVVRLKVEPGKTVAVNDIVRGTSLFDTTLLNDIVLMKSDGLPTYHFANVVDDHYMKVTHVLRGEEWLNSSPLHLLIYEAFGWTAPKFAHLPLILKPQVNSLKVNSSGKLSKRDGAIFGIPVVPTEWKTATEYYPGFDTAGYFPDVLLNFLAILSWSPGHNEEIMTLDRMIEVFNLEKVSKAGARFNIEKLNFMNKERIKNTPIDELIPEVRKHLPKVLDDFFKTDEYLAKVIPAMKERVTVLPDFYMLAPFLFTDKLGYDTELYSKHCERAKEISPIVREVLLSIGEENWNADYLKSRVEAIVDFSTKTYMPAMRMITTGAKSGPTVYEVMEVIGKESSIDRLEVFV